MAHRCWSVRDTDVRCGSSRALWFFWRAHPVATITQVSYCFFRLRAPACTIDANVESHLTARLYSRRNLTSIQQPNKQFNIPLQFEELFYDWSLSIAPDKLVTDAFVEIDHLKEDDVVTVVPEDAKVSQPMPKWLSGYTEPSRKKPDFYARQITMGPLAPDESAKISVRRGLTSPAIDDSDMIELEDIRSVPCFIKKHTLVPTEESDRLNHEATMLIRPPGVATLKHDVGDVAKDQWEASVDMTCKNRACTQMTVSRLIVRLGTPLNQMPPR
jgi:hypothetical protein